MKSRQRLLKKKIIIQEYYCSSAEKHILAYLLEKYKQPVLLKNRAAYILTKKYTITVF